MKIFDFHIKLLRVVLFTSLLSLSHVVLAQSDEEVSDFLDGFLQQVEDGGISIDQQYLEENTNMPPDMLQSLRDSLEGRETFQLTKEKAESFLSNFTKTIEKYGFYSDGNSIRLKDNRLLSLSIKGPDLSRLFGDVAYDVDTTSKDFEVHDINSDLYQPKPASNLDLNDPANNQEEVIYDPNSGNYIFSNRIGDEELNVPVEMDGDEYMAHSLENSMSQYWDANAFEEESESNSLLNMGLDFSASSQMFGKGAVNIKPQGYADLTFSVKSSKTDNPTVSEERRKNTYFDLDNKIQMNVLGSVGDKINLDMNYNTEATFDFDNEFKLEFNGKEDDILKNFKAGNVSMPSVGSMITVGGSSGGQASMSLPGYQKLWGFQNTQQYGRLTWSWVISQQESETETMTIEGGASKQQFEISADQYDANRHFFLTHFFKDSYDKWMRYLPNTDISGLNINKIEVWVTNKRGDFEQARNVLGFMDLAEPKPEYISNDSLWTSNGVDIPQNLANTLFNDIKALGTDDEDIRDINDATNLLSAKGLTNGEDYEKIENARLLSSSEYRVNSTLGYISLRSALNADEVLAVAFQFTYRGNVYQVGEFSSGDGIVAPDALYLKLLKATNQSPSLPSWDLMMKNVYSLSAYNVSSDDFRFDVVYNDDAIGTEVVYLNTNELKDMPLLRVMRLDTLDSSNEYEPSGSGDGFFDWVEGYTISPDNGRVIFPVREPFGSHLDSMISSDIDDEKYVFQELYDTTLVAAKQMAEKNKFSMVGSYKSASGSEIKLNAFNIPRGSVTVTAGGKQLQENVDYTVDYNSGYLRILNQGILESGQTIQVKMENQALFSMQKKTLLGTNLVYRFSDDLQVGASITHLRERPQTNKVAMGNDPIANTVWGLTGGWSTELPFLTKAIDKLPFTDTKAPSSMTVRGEVAQLIAGHHNAIGDDGAVYVDDFEATRIGLNVQNYFAWDLASVPATFEESELIDSVDYGFNRAKLAWYSIDRLLQQDDALTPSNIDEDEMSNHYTRSVDARQLFPKAEQDYGQSTYVSILNLAYYPEEKGPYNYDTDLDHRGRLNNPETRWAGITRKIDQPNFENTNIEYIEFWMMDPFVYEERTDTGYIYFNLGNISEDILKDGRKAFENGLPATELVEGVDTTSWGRVSTKQSLVDGFDNNETSRPYQDIGIDGLNNTDEQDFFAKYVADLQVKRDLVDPQYKTYIDSLIYDPSQDDFQYFRGEALDDANFGVLDRYKNYNNYEGNSPSTLFNDEDYSTAGTNAPDGEDINQDFTLSESDSYYEYGFKISVNDTAVGDNFIVDTRIEQAKLENGETEDVKWYQYRIPVHDYERVVGSINDFTSIRFMRMYMTGFKTPVVLRMANLELVRSEWRRYGLEIEPDIYDATTGEIDVEAVNFEENGNREPVNYILPPGVSRQTDPNQPQMKQLNEQSMVMRVRDLAGRDSRATYKVMEMDFRQYENLQMWVHAEQLQQANQYFTELEDEDLAIFIRLGSDYNDNYYEYELPLYITPEGYYSVEENELYDPTRYIVWPEDNRLDITLKDLTDLKLQRNLNNISTSEIFTQIIPDKPKQKISIQGNPSLSNVKMVMIGVRNTKSKTTDLRSAEVWVNEMRLTGLEEGGGWAGNGSVSLKVADLGSASATGAFSTSGWGSIEQTLMDRQLSDTRSYDVSTSMELGKLLPRKAKVQLPMYYAKSRTTVASKYDPLAQDLLLQDRLDAAETAEEKEAIKEEAEAFEEQTSINFSNVRVNISGKKKRFYDPVNLSLNYAFNERQSADETLDLGLQRESKAGFAYSFSPSPKPIEPFKKIKFLKSDHLALVRDFNFYLKPQKISYKSNYNRNYYEQQMTDLSGYGAVPLLVKEDEMVDNAFNFSYKLAKSLSVDYNFNTFSIVEDDYDYNEARESQLEVENQFLDDYERWWKAMSDSGFTTIGRVMDFNQTFNVRYALPFSKIPLLSFISVDAAYNSTYGWERGTEAFELTEDDGSKVWVDNGNLIRNTQRGTLNGSLKMSTLYNKSKYLSEVSKKYGKIGGNRRKHFKTKKFEMTDVTMKKGEKFEIKHKLGSEKATVKLKDANGKTIYGRKETKDEDVVYFTPNADVQGGQISVTARVEDKDTPAEKILGYTVNSLMGIKTVNVNWVRNGSTTLPGFRETNNLFPTSDEFAPGWGFALGQQNWNILTGEHASDDNAIIEKFYDKRLKGDEEKRWLVDDTAYFSEPYLVMEAEQISARATVEPLPGLSVKLSSNYMYEDRISGYYGDDAGNYMSHNISRSGNFSHTWIALGTMFNDRTDDEFYTSEAFENFKNYRSALATRVQAQQLSKVSSRTAYQDVEADPNSSEVLIPAFIAAYSGSNNPDNISMNVKPSWTSMLPNWQVTYSGLARAKILKKHVKSLTIKHTYACTYNVGNFVGLTGYDEETPFTNIVTVDDEDKVYYKSQYDIASLTVTEGLNPLIGIDLSLRNNVSFDFQMNKLRSLSLNIVSNQLIEMNNDELVIGAGYRFEDFKLFLKTSTDKKGRAVNNDLRLNADFSIRDIATIIRRIDEENTQPSSGNKVTALKVQANYNVNNNLEVTVFYDRQITSPVVSTSYKTSNSNFGVTFRFSLTN